MLDTSLRVLAGPRRQAILNLINMVKLSVDEIASHFDVTRPAVLQHLKFLADSRLLRVRRDGMRLFYRARSEGFSQLRIFWKALWTTTRWLDLTYQEDMKDVVVVKIKSDNLTSSATME